jgi:hypothetical protein
MAKEHRDDAAHPRGCVLSHWRGADVALNYCLMQMETARHLAAPSQAAAERLATDAQAEAANTRRGQERLHTLSIDLSDALAAQWQRPQGLEVNIRALATAIVRRDQELRATDQALERLRAEAASQRDKSDAHSMAAEDRDHAEVDRCREETKGLKQELTAAYRELLAATKARHPAVRAQRDGEKRTVAADAPSSALKERLPAKPHAAPTSCRAPKSGGTSLPKPQAAPHRAKS